MNMIDIFDHISPFQKRKCAIPPDSSNFYKSLNNYLDTLSYKSIYDRELTKILINLPKIYISNISRKLLNNISNRPNLIDLHEDLYDKYIAVD